MWKLSELEKRKGEQNKEKKLIDIGAVGREKHRGLQGAWKRGMNKHEQRLLIDWLGQLWTPYWKIQRIGFSEGKKK